MAREATRKSTRGKGEGSVYKRASDGMWVTSVELPAGLDGKRRRKVVARKNKNDVLIEMRKLQRELAKHGDLPTSGVTLAKWADYWMDRIAPKEVKPKTLEGYRTVITGYIVPLLGKKMLAKINAQDVRRLHEVMAATPKSPKLRGMNPDDWPESACVFTDSTGQHQLHDGAHEVTMLSSTYTLLAHNALSVMLGTALQEGKIHVNPCDMVSRPKKRVLEQSALSLEQSIQLLAHLTGNNDRALWATYLLTGSRRGEIIGLERDRVTDVLDLSWQLQRITDITKVPDDFEFRQIKGTLYLTRPKSSSGWRVIPLVEPLKSILELHLQDAPEEGLIFREEGRPWDPDRVTKAWKQLMRDADLPEDVVLHGARHTTVDLLYAAGVPEDIIQAIVGHSTRQMTRSYRTRTDAARLREGMESLSKLLTPQLTA
ncbi:Phage integrase, N-terminal SAM-like domain [Arthrobacter sp. yr096]|nr:Phage integrase, N-terminal SAM-like domain [Arthrobacter sp. yr096]